MTNEDRILVGWPVGEYRREKVRFRLALGDKMPRLATRFELCHRDRLNGR